MVPAMNDSPSVTGHAIYVSDEAISSEWFLFVGVVVKIAKHTAKYSCKIVASIHSTAQVARSCGVEQSSLWNAYFGYSVT